MGRTKTPVKQAARTIRKTVGGLTHQIVALSKKGYSRSEIIEDGYNRSTVHRQVHEFEIRSAHPAGRSSRRA